jgi:hypothetical protein
MISGHYINRYRYLIRSFPLTSLPVLLSLSIFVLGSTLYLYRVRKDLKSRNRIRTSDSRIQGAGDTVPYSVPQLLL